MPDEAAYRAVLLDAGLSEDAITPLVRNSTEGLRGRLLPSIRRILASQISSDERVHNKAEFLAKRVEFIEQRFFDSSNTLVQLMLTRTLRQLHRCKLEVPSNVYAGVYPWHSFNGYCVKRGSGYVVMIYNDLLNLTETVSAFVVAAMQTQTCIDGLMYMLSKYVHTRKIENDVLSFSSSVPLYSVVDLASASQQFLLMHELGHCVNQHEGYSIQPSEDEAPICRLKDQLRAEYEADEWAVNSSFLIEQRALSRKMHMRKGIPAHLQSQPITLFDGAILFFCLGTILESGSPRIRQDESHPPSILRLQALLNSPWGISHKRSSFVLDVLNRVHLKMYSKSLTEADPGEANVR